VALSRGTTISGVLGIIKLLLLLAPFAIFGGCSQPRTYIGLEVISYAFSISPLLIFLIVPVSALVATSMIIFNTNQPSDRILHHSKWTLGSSAVGLAELLFVAVYMWVADVGD
jgi:hypothetical protein